METLTHRLLAAVGSARGDAYERANLDTRFYNWSETPSIGSIPEVAETYAYLDGAYGIINEHQVAIGESTCPARLVSRPATKGGEALLDVSELSRLGMQRAKTAREAVQIMGDLAVEYGYYGAEWEGDNMYVEAGEALTVTDTKEAWMFHVLPDDTGKSAVWAAQRVPDDEMTAVANQFTIQELDLNNKDFFLASANVHDVAIRAGFWDPKDNVPFSFSRAYSQPRVETHKYYAARRIWRLFTLSNPSLDLSPTTDVYASNFPFSVKPSSPLSPRDIMRFQRDHYEGTEFDMTKGPRGGPYGDPDRYDEATREDVTKEDLAGGHFERAISIFRASYSFVSIADPANSDNGYIWFGQYAPHATTYAPVFTKVAKVPEHYTRGSLYALDRESSFWIHALVGNWAARYYTYAHPYVAKVQDDVEALAERLQADVIRHAEKVKLEHGEQAFVEFLTTQSAEFAEQAHNASVDLFDHLVTSFHDGYQVTNFNAAMLTVRSLFYPKWFLEQVGYFAKKETPAPETVAPAPVATKAAAETTAAPTTAETPAQLSGISYGVAVLIALISGSVGVFIGRQWRNPFARKPGYRPLE